MEVGRVIRGNCLQIIAFMPKGRQTPNQSLFIPSSLTLSDPLLFKQGKDFAARLIFLKYLAKTLVAPAASRTKLVWPLAQHWRLCHNLVPLHASTLFRKACALCPTAWMRHSRNIHTRVLAACARLNQRSQWNWPHSWALGFFSLKFKETAKALKILCPLLLILSPDKE